MCGHADSSVCFLVPASVHDSFVGLLLMDRRDYNSKRSTVQTRHDARCL